MLPSIKILHQTSAPYPILLYLLHLMSQYGVLSAAAAGLHRQLALPTQPPAPGLQPTQTALRRSLVANACCCITKPRRGDWIEN